jgi:hypothetical protein
VTVGNYGFGVKVHDNSSICAVPQPALQQVVGISFEERGEVNEVYVYRNYIRNFFWGISFDYTPADAAVIFRNIYVHDNILDNIGSTDTNWEYGIIFNSTAPNTFGVTCYNWNVYNNVIMHNALATAGHIGIYFILCGVTSRVIVRNNIIINYNAHPLYGIVSVAGAVITDFRCENNLCFNCGSDAFTLAVGITQTYCIINANPVADPLFVSTANHDFHLQAASPAIGTGLPVYKRNSDFDEAVIIGDVDKGCFQYIP